MLAKLFVLTCVWKVFDDAIVRGNAHACQRGELGARSPPCLDQYRHLVVLENLNFVHLPTGRQTDLIES